ncbi:LysR family transcriptional regulator [Dactylosporangium sp. NPDC005572]|uniref:LysR family transcriptional regulator n=1 Tax=Dactylosporangium sp. NPDC005572 TaxID=3156889 RepID=UPI0033A2AF23
MDTRQIRYFLAVVDHGGFGRAAAALDVAQPTLSQSVKSLERDLGAGLFHRAAHGVVLTAAGRAFLAPARQLMRGVALVVERDTVDLVAPAPLGAHPGARLAGTFARERPGVRVNLDLAGDDEIPQRIRDGASEVGLVYLPAARPGLTEVGLGVHELVLAYPPKTTPPPRIQLRTLHGATLLGVPEGSTPRLLVEAALRAAGVRTRVAIEAGRRDLLVELVLAGAGPAFLTDAAAPAASARGAVVRRLDPPLRLPYGLVHRTAELSTAAAAFVEHALRS